jgi:hypothetical protein
MDFLRAYVGALKRHPNPAAARDLPNILHWTTAGQRKTGQWGLTPGTVTDFGGGVKAYATGPEGQYVMKTGMGTGQATAEDIEGLPGWKLITKPNGDTVVVRTQLGPGEFRVEDVRELPGYKRVTFPNGRTQLIQPGSDLAARLNALLNPDQAETGKGKAAPQADKGKAAKPGVQRMDKADFDDFEARRASRAVVPAK